MEAKHVAGSAVVEVRRKMEVVRENAEQGWLDGGRKYSLQCTYLRSSRRSIERSNKVSTYLQIQRTKYAFGYLGASSFHSLQSVSNLQLVHPKEKAGLYKHYVFRVRSGRKQRCSDDATRREGVRHV